MGLRMGLRLAAEVVLARRFVARLLIARLLGPRIVMPALILSPMFGAAMFGAPVIGASVLRPRVIAARLIGTVVLTILRALMHPLLPAIPIAAFPVAALAVAGKTIAAIGIVATFIPALLAPLLAPLLAIAVPPVRIAAAFTALAVGIAILLVAIALRLTLGWIAALATTLVRAAAVTTGGLHRCPVAATVTGQHRLTLIFALGVGVIVRGAEFTRHRPRPLDHSTAGVAAIGRLLRRHDDPIVVLGMLQVVLGHDNVAGRLRIARQRHVFLGDVGRVAANLHARSIALIVARERVLSAAVDVALAALTMIVAAVIVTAAASAVLLSLPHWAPISIKI